MSTYEEHLAAYTLAMSLVREMARRGILSERDSWSISPILARKCGISLSSIFLELPCYSSRDKGICHASKGENAHGTKD